MGSVHTSILFCRWNSTWDLLNSFQRLKPSVVQTISNIENAPEELTREEWKKLEQVVKVLQPFKEATEMLSRYDASISMAIPIVTIIMKSLEMEDRREEHGVLGMKRALKKAMSDRFSAMEDNIYFSAATLLDSKFKNYFYREPGTLERTKNLITEELVQLLRREDSCETEVLINELISLTLIFLAVS